MKVVIEGATKIGQTLARIISTETKNPESVMLLDKDPERAKKAAETLDVLVIDGSLLTDEEKDHSTEMSNIDVFVAATDDEAKNLVLCSLVEDKYHPNHNIAVIYDENLAGLSPYKNIKTFVPPRATARAIRRYMSSNQNALEKLISGAKSELLVYEIDKGHQMIGKSISSIKVPKDKYNPVMVGRGEDILYPSKDFVLEENDIIQVVVDTQYVEKVKEKLEP